MASDERSMTYEAFHELLGAQGADPCEAIFGDCLTWPDYSYENTGDSYQEGWIYDHKRGVAFRGCIGDIVESLGDDLCK